MLGTIALAAGSTAAEPDRRLPPNENTPSTSVHPFPDPDVQHVSTGDWIVHRIGWVSPTETELEDFFGKYELRAWIDGEPVDDFDSYRGDVVEADDGCRVFWRYTTPPKPPGKYEFRTRFEFTDGLDNGKYDAGDVADVTGTYEVVAGSGRGGRRTE